MGDLRVELHGVLLGTLRGVTDDFDFTPADEGIRAFGLGSSALSVSIPLVPRQRGAGAALRRNFFAELLPEGAAREQLAREADVSKDDVLGLLRAYGRDVAGALQVFDPDDPFEPRTPAVIPLDDDEVEAALNDVRRRPLGNVPRRGKTSLAGVQDKLLLVRGADHTWARAVDGYATTHILKPVSGEAKAMIFDEEYGSRFARALGSASFRTELEQISSTVALVIERYDRAPTAPDGRLHQEDFSQVLGLSGDQKYEKFRGRPMADIAAELDAADRVELLRRLTLSAAVGNLDLHAKNISLLHSLSGEVRLAPMYDIVPMRHYDNDQEMAFAVSGTFMHKDLTSELLAREGEAWGVREAGDVVATTLRDVRAVAERERPHVAASLGLRDDVLGFTTNLMEGRAADDSGDGTYQPGHASGAAEDGGWSWGTQPLPSANQSGSSET